MIDRRLRCFAGFAATLVGLFFRNGLAHAMRGRLVARAPLAVNAQAAAMAAPFMRHSSR